MEEIRRRRRRRVYARRGPRQRKGSLPGMVQPACSFFTVNGDTRGTHGDFLEFNNSCTSGESSSPGYIHSCKCNRLGSGVHVEKLPAENSTQAPGGFRGRDKDAGKQTGKQSCRNFSTRLRRYDCITTFSKCIRSGQSVLARKYAVQESAPPKSQERDGETPKDSAISVGQLRSPVSSCFDLPMLFQLTPRAVSDLLREAWATDGDTVSRVQIFTDSSSHPEGLAPCGGLGWLVSSHHCDLWQPAHCRHWSPVFFLRSRQCPCRSVWNTSYFCGFGVVSCCQFGGQRCDNQTRQQVCHWCAGLESPLHCRRAAARTTRQCLKQGRSKFGVTVEHTEAH